MTLHFQAPVAGEGQKYFMLGIHLIQAFLGACWHFVAQV